jgi:hypothetical protein
MYDVRCTLYECRQSDTPERISYTGYSTSYTTTSSINLIFKNAF